jgi:hypothetical protein
MIKKNELKHKSLNKMIKGEDRFFVPFKGATLEGENSHNQDKSVRSNFVSCAFGKALVTPKSSREIGACCAH